MRSIILQWLEARIDGSESGRDHAKACSKVVGCGASPMERERDSPVNATVVNGPLVVNAEYYTAPASPPPASTPPASVSGEDSTQGCLFDQGGGPGQVSRQSSGRCALSWALA